MESVCEADVSLVTGHIRRMGLESEDDTDVGTGTLAEQKPMTVGVIHSAGTENVFRSSFYIHMFRHIKLCNF